MKKEKRFIGSYIYGEWLIPVIDYFVTLKRKEITFEIVFPIVISIIITLIYKCYGYVDLAVNHLSDMLPNILAILIGFTISAIAILIGADDKNESLQGSLDDRKVDGKPITVNQYILVILIYVLLQEVINLGVVFLIEFIKPLVESKIVENVALFLFVFYLLHILLIIIRAIVYLYSKSFKDGSSSGSPEKKRTYL